SLTSVRRSARGRARPARRAAGVHAIGEQMSDRPDQSSKLKITAVECHALLAPNYDPRFTSSAQDSFIVVIRTDGGVTGIGESDVNPWMAKAAVEAPGTHTMGLSIKEMLIGADPFAIDELWRRM